MQTLGRNPILHDIKIPGDRSSLTTDTVASAPLCKNLRVCTQVIVVTQTFLFGKVVRRLMVDKRKITQ